MPKVLSWEVLKSLGFIEDPTLFSDSPGGLSFNFGNFKLSASFCTNRWFQPIILLSGVMSTRRTIGLVDCEMPQEVESREQAIAWVSWCLDNESDGKFRPVIPVPWLEEGRKYRALLPWEKERIAFAARPHCIVDRDWMKVALHKLRPSLESASDGAIITLEFDGEVLKIQYPNGTIAMPASGTAWTSRFTLPVSKLMPLPKRLMYKTTEISIRKSSLRLGRRAYPGVVTVNV